MKKTFCDRCGNEIDDKTSFSVLTTDVIEGAVTGDVLATIRVVYVHNPDDIDLCKYCALDALNRLDDRPKEMSSRG